MALLTRSVAPSGPRVALACLAAACLVLVIGSTPAKASTTYVDGISDQNLAYWWGTGFYSMFSDAWVGEPAAHIKLARYVGQWNDPADFRLWLERVPPGLAIDVALTEYHRPYDVAENPGYPSSPQEYGGALREYLSLASSLGRPIQYVEPWNEPNNQGGYRTVGGAAEAAHFADRAGALCASYGCAVIAGDVEDIPSEVGGYMASYVANLDFTPGGWGVHPYYAVDLYGARASGMAEFEADCGGCHPWFTEVGAWYCAPGSIGFRGAQWQAEHAADLVDGVIPRFSPEHVFYYELKAPTEEARCAGETDTALYGADGDPRPAAGVIFGPQGSALRNPSGEFTWQTAWLGD